MTTLLYHLSNDWSEVIKKQKHPPSQTFNSFKKNMKKPKRNVWDVVHHENGNYEIIGKYYTSKKDAWALYGERDSFWSYECILVSQPEPIDFTEEDLYFYN